MKSIAFGTDGIRGHADQWPFTDDSLYILGDALSMWIRHKYGSNVSIMVGYDTRESAQRIKEALAHGLLHEEQAAPWMLEPGAEKLTLYDAGVIPTPMLLWWARQQKNVDVALMISASHNPYYDNGIKLFEVASGKITADDEQMISGIYNRLYEGADEYNFQFIGHEEESPFVLSLDWQDAYVAWIKTVVAEQLWYDGTVVLDLANGALSEVAKKVFDCFVSRVVVLNAEPNGKNINDGCGALHPEKIVDVMRKEKALLGFAFDGDGDRVLAVDEQGIVRDGDDILYLLLQHPDFSDQKTVVGTVMTNGGFEYALKERGLNLIRTAVGDKHVAEALLEHQSRMGGEPSGHLILKPYISTGDGLFVAIKVLEAVVKNYGALSASFRRFTQVNTTLVVSERTPLEQLPCFESLQLLEQKITPGRMIVRYSGTEPLLRITTEHVDASVAQGVNQEVLQLLKEVC